MNTAVLAEAAAMPWRRRASERTLSREGRIWTLWSVGVLVTFGLPAALLIWIEPLAFPVSAIFLGHGIAVLQLQARRGARGVKPIGEAGTGPERAALGLLGDLVGRDARELLTETGLALQRGRLGAWLVGQEGAILVRPGAHRVHCFCVRVGEAGDLPPGDRVAHLLLALREDEQGFATVANRNFSGAAWRVGWQLPGRARPALGRARQLAPPSRAASSSRSPRSGRSPR
ncbi:MAG TPA: hypothetical protein VGJ61_08595 [Solirubrobacterales bacterium]